MKRFTVRWSGSANGCCWHEYQTDEYPPMTLPFVHVLRNAAREQCAALAARIETMPEAGNA